MAESKSGPASNALPAGPTNLKKNLAAGMSLSAATAKATQAPVTPKAR